MAALTAITPHLRTPGGRRYTTAGAEVQEDAVRPPQKLLEDGRRTGELDAVDPRAMALMMRGAIASAAVRATDPSFDSATYAGQVVATFIRAHPRHHGRRLQQSSMSGHITAAIGIAAAPEAVVSRLTVVHARPLSPAPA